MKTFLVLVGLILVTVYFLAEKIFDLLLNKDKISRPRGIPVPDLSLALKNDRTRQEFARRLGQKKLTREAVRTPSIEIVRRPGETIAPGKDSLPIVPEKAKELPQLETPQVVYPTIHIQSTLAPESVEQGQKDQIVTLKVKNLTDIGFDIASIQLQFQAEKGDVSSEYIVRAQAGNPARLAAKASADFKLSVDISPTATLGKVTILPNFLGLVEQATQRVKIATGSFFQWKVEPTGRVFQLSTEHNGTETAGVPFSLELQAYLQTAPEVNYSGLHRIQFYLERSAAVMSTPPQIPEYLDLVFAQGKAVTPPLFCLYNSMTSYVLMAKDTQAGGAHGDVPVTLHPGELGSFQLTIVSPQSNRMPFQGENTLVVLDAYNNIKTDFAKDVTISCTVGGQINGLGGLGNVISGSVFANGLARLSGLTYVWDALPEGGKIVKFMASSEGKTSYSEDITILPGRAMSPSATQAVIRRLLESRKHKVWMVNCDPDLNKMLEANFRGDYDVRVTTLLPGEIGEKLSPPPDMLFLDAGTPPQDGYTILKEIRKVAALEALPILFLGIPSASEGEISEVLKTGSAYLSKPTPPNKFPMPAIRAMVTDLLEKAALGRGHLPTPGSRLPGSEGSIYQIVSKLGEGGMGYIYDARRLRDQQQVIIKYLPPRELRNITSVVRFIQEAHTVLSFHHENLVSGYDLFMDRNRCYYMMEYIDGQTVETLLRLHTKLDPARSTRIVLQVARALQSLEEDHHLVHRDIKPANIIVTNEGLAKLVDFGIAKLTNHNLTTMGIILGTPYYLSPEQISGEPVTSQSDIYSLGATYYHMVTGEVPFQGQDVCSIIHQRLSRNPRDPRELNPNIPRAMAEVIIKMMHRKANRRYETIRVLVRELETLLQCIDSGILALEGEIPLENLEEEPQAGQ